MRFWDSSAVVPLLVEEESSSRLLELYAEEALLVWWATAVECASALARLERSGALSPADTSAAFGRLDSLEEAWLIVEPTPRLARSARRLLRTHDLRAGDSLQLAAALAAAEGEPSSLPFVCLDDRLRLAADREGLEVLGRESL